MADISESFVYDRWLTRVLERDVYRLVIDEDFVERARETSSPEHKRLEELQSRPDFIYARVPITALGVVDFLVERGFRLIETNVTLEKPIDPGDAVKSAGIRLAAPADRNGAIDVAAHSFSLSRFHQDSTFSTELADRTRTEWVKSYFDGRRGDAMLVAEEQGVITGFLLLVHGQDSRLVIDLIAVAPEHRRKGIARDMIASAASSFPGFSHLRVGTQLGNLPSLALYEGLGFRVYGAQYTFHYHHK